MDLKGDSVAAVSSALDPRHKNLKFLSSEMQFSVQEHVRFLVNLVTTDKEPVVEEEPATKKSAMVLLLGSDYYDDQQLLRDEYSYFLEEPAIHPNSNPLIWWKQNAQKFPKVALVAKRFLCAPATSVPSERVFSAAGNIVNKKRCSLLPENVNTLIF